MKYSGLKRYILALFGGFLAISVAAQERVVAFGDTLDVPYALLPPARKQKGQFKPIPSRAVKYALFPGGGEIYNRKWWKLPIVYGGFLACWYAFNWNNTQYGNYQNAYHDFTDPDPETNRWLAFKSYSYDSDPSLWTEQQRSSFTNSLRTRKDFFRRDKELSIIIAVGLYGLCMIDSYVDAKLFDFDVSDNISMHVQPTLFSRPAYNNSLALGVHCSLNF
ncbi:hypothetical protein AGMMS49965_06070 [Bacteroidia bacterium]|nr:hypothetical protein AGMMS49965_06070 [Bacteroidia bacterium]